MTLSYVNTNDDSADMFTKQLPQEPFEKTVGTQVFSEKSSKAAIFPHEKGLFACSSSCTLKYAFRAIPILIIGPLVDEIRR